jgi:hypothetical protein
MQQIDARTGSRATSFLANVAEWARLLFQRIDGKILPVPCRRDSCRRKFPTSFALSCLVREHCFPGGSDRPDVRWWPVCDKLTPSSNVRVRGPSGKHMLVLSSSQFGRVGMWRGGFRLHISVTASFVWRCLAGVAVTPFPHPARRTGQADLPHPALGQELTPSPTAGRGQARLDVRAQSARIGARVDKSRPCVV